MLLGFPRIGVVNARRFSCLLLKNFPPVAVCPIRTPFSKTRLSPHRGNPEILGFSKLNNIFAKETVRRFTMASPLLNFQVWDGSANIAARHSAIRPIGSKVKSPAWSCLTSSFANIAIWKRVTSDCIPRKSVFRIALAPEITATQEKSRLCVDEQKSDGNRSVEAPVVEAAKKLIDSLI